MQRTVSLLVHGPAKSGKSTMAATMPKPMLYLDVEGGTRFLQMRKTYWEPLMYAPPICDGSWDVCVVMVRDYDEVRRAYDVLATGQHCFEGVSIDSISRLQGLLVEKITNREQAKMQDWGDVFRGFMGLIRDYHGLTTNPYRPMSVCLVSESKEQDGRYAPFVQGQSKTTLPYVVDILAALEIVTWFDDVSQQQMRSHRLTTGPHPRYETGERVGGRIPEALDNATMPLILDYVYGVEPSTVPPQAVQFQPQISGQPEQQ